MRVQVHAGTAEHYARVVRIGDRYAQLRLASPAVAARGDRLVLRERTTIGGALVLDPAPPRRLPAARPALPGPRGPAPRPAPAPPLLGAGRRGAKAYAPGASAHLGERATAAERLEAELEAAGFAPLKVEDRGLARFLEEAGRAR